MTNAALETAKRDAIQEVESLLQRPDDLKRLPGMLQSYTSKHQVRLSYHLTLGFNSATYQRESPSRSCVTFSLTRRGRVDTHNPNYIQGCHRVLNECPELQAAKAQLTSTVASQVDAVRSGLEVLSNAQKTLSTMRNCYAVSLYCLPFVARTLLHAEDRQSVNLTINVWVSLGSG